MSRKELRNCQSKFRPKTTRSAQLFIVTLKEILKESEIFKSGAEISKYVFWVTAASQSSEKFPRESESVLKVLGNVFACPCLRLLVFEISTPDLKISLSLRIPLGKLEKVAQIL